MALGFFTGDNTPDSYEARERKRRIAEALLSQSMSQRPIGSWTEGAAKLAQALAGTYKNSKIEEQERESNKAYNEKYGQIAGSLFGGSPSPAPSTSVNSAPGPMADAGGGPNPSLIASESGGNWQAKNDAVGAGGKVGHFGRLQFGQARLQDAINAGAIPPGTTPEQFMANPELQKAAERWHFADIDKAIASGPASRAIGSAIGGVPVTREGLRAVAHLGGVGGMNKFVESGGQYNPADANGTRLMDYLRRHGGGTPAPVQTVSLDGLPPGPVASDAPPMAYAGAPAGQAIAGASPQPQARPPGQQLAQAVAPTSPPIPQPQPTGNVNAAMYQIMSDPRFSPQQKAQALQMFQMQQRDEGVTYVDAGDKLVPVNKRGQVVGQPITKTREGADWQLVKDENGNPIGRFNARTGTTEPISGSGGLPQGSQKAPTTRVVKQADGSEVATQWDGKKGEWVPLNAPQGGNPVANPKLTEGQSKDLNYALRGEDLLPILEDQDKALTEFFSANASKVPVVGNLLKSDEYRQAEQTGRELLAAILRKDTGAAVTESEMQLYSGMYLPQPGDDQKTIEQKRAGRSRAIEGIKLGIGPARILLEQRKSLESAKPKKDSKEAAPARKTLGGKTYEKRGSDWFEVQ